MPQLPNALIKKLREFSLRQRWTLLLGGAGEGLLVLFLGLAAETFLDFSVVLAEWKQVAIAVSVYLLAIGIFVWRGLWRSLRRTDFLQIAREVERSCGKASEELLSSAVELAESNPEGVSKWMINRTIALAAQDYAGMDLREMVDFSRARGKLRGAAAGGILICLLCIIPDIRPLVLRAMIPGANIPRPSVTKLLVNPGDGRQASGNRLIIKVKAYPATEEAMADITWEDGREETLRLRAEDGGKDYTLIFPSLTQSFRYHIRAGDAVSRKYKIAVDSPPRIEEAVLEVTPPSYSGFKPYKVQSGDARILVGSMVRMKLKLGGPETTSATLIRKPAADLPLTISGNTAEVSWKLMSSGEYRMRIVGRGGIVSTPPQRWRIEAVEDQPPGVSLSCRGGEKGLAGIGEQLLFKISGNDDIGLSRLELEIRRGDKVLHSEKVKVLQASSRESFQLLSVDLSGLDLHEGQVISASARAVDSGGLQSKSVPLQMILSSEPSAEVASSSEKLSEALKILESVESELPVASGIWRESSGNFRPEDPAEHKATIVLAADAIGQMLMRANRAGKMILAEVDKLDNLSAGFGVQTANGILRWQDFRGGMLLKAVEKSLHEETNGKTNLRLVSDLAEYSIGEITVLRRKAALLSAYVEMQHLAALGDAAYARQKRSLSVLDGYLLWDFKEDCEPGLRLEFFRNMELKENPVYVSAGLPLLNNYDVPGHGINNWSLRAEGQALIKDAGKHRFICRADDGVRLWVAGKSLFGDNGWKEQGVTEYSGEIELAAGWHPVKIEMYQSFGPSALWFGFFEKDKPVQFDLSKLRHKTRDLKHQEQAFNKMSDIDGDILGRIFERISHDSNTLVGSVRSMQQVSDKLEGESQAAAITRKSGEAASRLSAFSESGKLELWTREKVRKSDYYSLSIKTGSRKLLSLITSRMKKEVVKNITDSDFLAERISEIGERIKNTQLKSGNDLSEEKIESVAPASSAELAAMEARMKKAETELRRKASHPSLNLYERQMFFKALEGYAKTLDTMVPEIRELSGTVQDIKNANDAKKRIADLLAKCSAEIREAGKFEDLALKEGEKRLSSYVAASTVQSEDADKTGGIIEREKAASELRADFSSLADYYRQTGKIEEARELGQIIGLENTGELIKHAKKFRIGETSSENWSMGDRLKREAGSFEKKSAAELQKLANRLADESVRLDILARLAEQKTEFEKAGAYRRINRDLRQILKQRELGKTELDNIADRVEAVEGRAGGDKYDREIEAAANDRGMDHDSREMLGRLAAWAKNAGAKEKLSEILGDREDKHNYAEILEDAEAWSKMEKRAEGLAADIINGETQKAEFDLKEKATLKKLTASADGMAVGLKQISKDITALSAQNIPDPVKNIAKDILQKLPVLEAKAAADLQSDLPGMIKHLEDVQAEIREQIVKPLARSAGEAFFEADNPAALANIAKEGRKLAGLAASCNQAVAEARDFANRKSGYDRQFKRKVTEGEDMLEDLKAELSRMNQVLPEDQGQETDNKILANRLMAYGASGLRVSEREAERALKYGSDATQSDPEKVSSRAVARAAKMISSKDPAMHSAAATELAKSARRADSAGYAPLYGGTIAAETGDSPVQVPFDQVGNHLTNEGAGWAKLKRDLRDRIGGENPEIFGGEYEEAIRAYFKRLGEL